MASVLRKRLSLAALVFFLMHRSAFALPDRPLSFDIGLGMPEVLFLHGQVQAMKRWQFGVGYSYLPTGGFLGQTITGNPTSITLADGLSYATSPTVVPTANYLSAFVRFFPAENNFYFQFTYSLLQMNAHVTSGLENTDLATILTGALVSADVVFKQILPTVSIGYLFMGRFFFANVALGASWVGTLSTKVTVNALIPDAVGGSAGNQQALTQFQTDIERQGRLAVADIRTRFPIFPSLSVSFGFQF